MANVPEEITRGSVSQFMSSDVNGSGSGVMANGVNESIPSVIDNGVDRFVSQVRVNGVIGYVPRVVVNGVVCNGVGVSAAEVMNDGVSVIGNDVGGSDAQNMTNGVSGSVSEIEVNGVGRLVSQVQADGVIANGVGGSVDPGMANGEVREDIARVRVYRATANGLRITVRRRRERIRRLEALGNCQDAIDTIRFWERMQLDDVEKGTRALLMMRKTEAKIREKARAAADDGSLAREINGQYDGLTARNSMCRYIKNEMSFFWSLGDANLWLLQKLSRTYVLDYYVRLVSSIEIITWCMQLGVGSRGWLDMMVLYCRKSASEDQEVALRFNRLRGDRIVAFENRMDFFHELENVTGVSVVVKTIVVLKEMMEKENSRDYHLENLENETKQRALEMDSFVQKWVDVCILSSHGAVVAYFGVLHFIICYRRLLITKFRYKADSSDWTDVLTYFCREAADEDRRIATELNRLREEILIVYEKRRNFADELKVAQLREVESQMESRAFEKELFIQKLVGNTECISNVGVLLIFEFLCKLAAFPFSGDSCWYLYKECICIYEKKRTMEWLRMCEELEKIVGGRQFRSLGEDYRIAREINLVALELNNVVTEKDKFLEELDSLAPPVAVATAVFLIYPIGQGSFSDGMYASRNFWHRPHTETIKLF
nr:hypothetical protein [Tanacetum cinerariifolium]